MDLDAIAVFVKVVQAGSFSAAARLLDMPKTTVSAKVAALEKRLGVSLIQRTTRKLHVTEAGSKYFEHCVNAVREVELAEAAILSSQSKPSGLLRITAPVDIGHTLLPQITRAYLQRYADTAVEMLISNQVFDLVGEGIDLAIRAGAMKDSSLVARRFFDLHARLWTSPAYLKEVGPLSHPDELARCRLVGHTSLKTLEFTNGKSEAHIALVSRVMTNDFEALKAMLLLGEGIGWLPDFLTTDAADAGLLVPALPGWESKTRGAFYFVYPGRKYASPKVQAFIETALKIAGARKAA